VFDKYVVDWNQKELLETHHDDIYYTTYFHSEVIIHHMFQLFEYL